MIKDFFQILGFNEKETSIYLYLTSHWSQIASTIAKKTDTKRASIYSILKWMLEKWLIIDYTKNKLTYFKAIEPEDIDMLCDRKERELKKVKKDSKQIQWFLNNLKEKQVTDQFDLEWKVTYYEWIEAVSNLIEETLEEPVKEQLCFWLNEYHTKVHTDDWSSYRELCKIV